MNRPRRFVRTFKPRFAPLVEQGLKLQTMRPHPKVMPRPGDIIDCRMWSGKPYRSKMTKLCEGTITRVGNVRIEARRIPECPDIFLEGQWLDGFETAAGIVIYWERAEGKEAHG